MLTHALLTRTRFSIAKIAHTRVARILLTGILLTGILLTGVLLTGVLLTGVLVTQVGFQLALVEQIFGGLPQILGLLRQSVLTFGKRLLCGCDLRRLALETTILIRLLHRFCQALLGLINRLIGDLLNLLTCLLHRFGCRLIIQSSLMAGGSRQIVSDLLNVLCDAFLLFLRCRKTTSRRFQSLTEFAGVRELLGPTIQLFGPLNGIFGVLIGQLGRWICRIELRRTLVLGLLKICLGFIRFLLRQGFLTLALFQQATLIIQIRFLFR